METAPLAASREATGSDRVLDERRASRRRGGGARGSHRDAVLPSIAGISHAPEEDTTEADLIAAIEAFGLLANRVLGSDLA